MSLADSLDLEKSLGVGFKKKAYEIKEIDIDKLVPNPDNFYHIGDLTELKRSILREGILASLVVTPLPDGRYMLVSGHRRCQAVQELLDGGEKVERKLPCKIERDKEKAAWMLITSNATQRDKTPWEEVLEVAKAHELIAKEHKPGDKPTREILQERTGKSSGAIGRIMKIYHNAADETKEALQKGRLSVSTAYELCRLTVDDQTRFFNISGQEKYPTIERSLALFYRDQFLEQEENAATAIEQDSEKNTTPEKMEVADIAADTESVKTDTELDAEENKTPTEKTSVKQEIEAAPAKEKDTAYTNTYEYKVERIISEISTLNRMKEGYCNGEDNLTMFLLNIEEHIKNLRTNYRELSSAPHKK